MKTVSIDLEITEPVSRMLTRLVATGFYGANEAEAAERLLCHALETNPFLYGADDDEQENHEQPRCSVSRDGRHFRGCGCP